MKYYIKTYGCQMNESDSERIASFLENKGYKKAPIIEGANLVVVNACSVRQTAIDRIFGLKPKILKFKFQNSNVKFILTGCILKSDKPKFEEFFDAVLGIKDFFTYHLFSDRTKDGTDYTDYLELQSKYSNPKSAFVPIMTGCDNFCSYCVVPYVRGREKSRPIKEILCEVKNLIKQRYKEITLLGQNVNSYEYGFSKLLQKLNTLPGKFTIKFLTSHPKDFSDELIDTIIECKKIAKEIHLPVQSGDDEILRRMNRGYTIKQYKDLVKKIRQKILDVKISTDAIVGFSGETKKQFEDTIKLFKEIKFDKAYINKYSPRPDTAAFKLKDNVSWKEKKKRWKILNDLMNKKDKLILILGPTASGKSGLAIKIAKDFSGEIVSADSRQVYKEMNIGTAKPFKNQKSKIKSQKYLVDGVPHYLFDVISPKRNLTVAQYKKLALKAINEIQNKGKIPILCGGTGFYIRAITENLNIPEVKPDWKLRKELEKKNAEELFKKLKKLDPNRAKNIDAKNKRRLIRAIEIILKTKKPIPQMQTNPQYDVLYLGIKKSLPEFKKSINRRIDKMIKNGLEKEVKRLVKKYGWTQVIKNTIGYAEFREFTTSQVVIRVVINAIKLHTYQFAKRQMTWFKKHPGKRVNWIKNYTEAKKLIRKFLL